MEQSNRIPVWGGRKSAMTQLRLEYKILVFLSRHPHALDSLQGVAAFWLEGEEEQTVHRALERLVGVGLMQSVGKCSEALYYTNNPELIADIIDQAKEIDLESLLRDEDSDMAE